MPKHIAVFMGAGASKPFGIPLTREILPLILTSIEENDLFRKIPEGDYSAAERKKMETDLRNFLFELLPGLQQRFSDYLSASEEKRKSIEFPLITEILSLVDHLNVNNNVPFFRSKKANPAEGLAYYRNLLDRAIYEILADNEEYEPEEKSKLKKFVDYITRLIHENNKVSLITTNYDTTVEMEIYRRNFKQPSRVNFGFSWLDVYDGKTKYQPDDTRLSILKLHGSLNWLKCDLCDHVYINPDGNIIHQAFRNDVDGLNSCHCGNAPLKSLIVAPSFERDVRDSNLLHTWKTALHELRAADQWVMIGYSLPPEDLAIKSLLLRAKNARDKKLKREDLVVVQHGDRAKESYSILFGEKNFNYLSNGLEEFLAVV